MKALLTSVALAALLITAPADAGQRDGYQRDRQSDSRGWERGKKRGGYDRDRRHHRGKRRGHRGHHHDKPEPKPTPSVAAAPERAPWEPDTEKDQQTLTRFQLHGRAPSEDGGNDKRMMSALASGSVSPREIVKTCDRGCWKLKPDAQQDGFLWRHIGPFFGHLRATVGERDVRE